MEATEVSIKDILSYREFPIAVVKSCEKSLSIPLYKTSWTSSIGEELRGVMESSNLMDKKAVAVQRNDAKVVGHLPLEKPGKFQRQDFTSLKQTKNILVESMCLGRP